MPLADRIPNPPPCEIDDSVERLLIENAVDMIVLCGPDMDRLYVSPACLDITGYSPAELLAHVPTAILHPDDADRVFQVWRGLTADHPTVSAEWRLLRRDGSYCWMESTYRRLTDGRVIAVVRDVQARKDIEQRLQEAIRQLKHLAMHDPLTDLPNRRCFIETVDRRLASAAADQRHALFLVDLDHFKPVNDLHGHIVGDQALIEVSGRLLASCGVNAVVARLGGDEFAALIAADDRKLVHRTSEAIRQAVSAPFSVDQAVVTLGASIGIAMAPNDGTDTASLLKCADSAMYRCKHASRQPAPKSDFDDV